MKRSYIYTPSGQVLYQRNHANPSGSDEFFYVHDRLGSVRLLVDENGSTQNSYTYDPSGMDFASEIVENIDDIFKFTGQWFDSEIEQYYLRARMYDPALMRFTGRDPILGEQEEPLTLHRYLYCANDPINHTDLSGKVYLNVANGLKAAATVYSAGLLIACYGVKTNNLELTVAGSFVIELAPVAYAIGLGFGDKMVTVTRWGNPGKGPGYVMAGKKSYLNYLLSGKWQPGLGNQYAAYSTGHSFEVMASQLKFPNGWKWIFGLVGQSIYSP